MTVAELISRLGDMPQDATVYLPASPAIPFITRNGPQPVSEAREVAAWLFDKEQVVVVAGSMYHNMEDK